MLISEEHLEEEEEHEHEADQQSNQPTAKIGAKKQRKLEEKQARKAQREVREHNHRLLDMCCKFQPFLHLQITFQDTEMQILFSAPSKLKNSKC